MADIFLPQSRPLTVRPWFLPSLYHFPKTLYGTYQEMFTVLFKMTSIPEKPAAGPPRPVKELLVPTEMLQNPHPQGPRGTGRSTDTLAPSWSLELEAGG